MGQKVPENAPEKCRDFLNDMSLPVYEQFYNMDETPCYFDMPRSGTYDFRGIGTVKLKTPGYEKLRFTTVLTTGIRKLPNNEWKVTTLPPMLIFKNLVKPPKGKFPLGMCVIGSKGGSMTGKMMKESYVPMIYKGRPVL